MSDEETNNAPEVHAVIEQPIEAIKEEDETSPKSEEDDKTAKVQSPPEETKTSPSEAQPEESVPEEETVAAGEAERNVDVIKTEKKSAAAGANSGRREISQPSYVKRMPATLPDKKCFVKIVAIGDSGVGKTSLI